ncbi:ATP-binding protein [Candidatus Entotheonella palauensis]|uniref:ATP-binding protein n=1 Tax=Candidatus Entotheonella palauensis TaxID=93172 RepID=UPI000B7E61C5|nr:ATP-binding protein [Candidatus Entotheonella palauensis]
MIRSVSDQQGDIAPHLASQENGVPLVQGALGLNDAVRSGSRLFRLEVFNWGTFHGRVWSIKPRGNTALLTGENGSGKSTLVDALLTLLVPNQKRNYNQASGAAARRERNELSYVRGAYAKLQGQGDHAAQTQYLRDQDSYSVLLAYFRNEAQGRDVTLAQVFWYQDGVKKFYVVSPQELDIASGFSQFTNIRALKERLRSHGAEVYEQFERYSRRFRALLGLQSAKSLDVLNQTVMIKDIDRLSDFVRQHMLDPTDVHEKIRQLLEHYDNLTTAYDALRNAEYQYKLLVPLEEEAGQYAKCETEIAELDTWTSMVPVYFAGVRAHLIQTAMARTQVELDGAHEQYQQTTDQLNALREQDKRLTLALNQEQAGPQLQALEQQMTYVRQELARKQRQAEQYDTFAQSQDLQTYGNEAGFYANRRQAEQLQPMLRTQRQQVEARLSTLQLEREQLSLQRRTLQQELESMARWKNQIPGQQLTLRSRLLEPLGMREEEIPFVGELLRVLESESLWEGAIERVLRNFALDMLVPESHYHEFSSYINRTHLRGRIVYHRIRELDGFTAPRHVPDNALIDKIEIKPDNIYHDWLRHELHRRFDYECCDNMDAFAVARKAMTPEGLIKSGYTRHEKDDRYDIRDRRNYILGWDNAAKRHALEQELDALTHKQQQNESQLNTSQQTLEALTARQEQLSTLLSFDDFEAIDWQREVAKIEQLQVQKAQLTLNSDRLMQLQDELEDIQSQIRQVETQLQNLNKTTGGLEHQYQQWQQELAGYETERQHVQADLLTKAVPHLEALINDDSTLDNVAAQQRQVEGHLRTARGVAERQRQGAAGTLIRTMQRYKSTFPETTQHLDASLQALPMFEQILDDLRTDDLPRYRERFKNLLNEKVLEHIAFLYGDLHKQIEAIDERLTTLNTALQGLDYTPSTYIQLQAEPTRDAEVRAFREQLQACLPDVAAALTNEDYEASFQRIQELITRFQEDARWTGKVIDVRHWLDFAASERYRSNGQEKHYYSDSAGKSGGQKAKLAYTILASAIAYQYGLQDESNGADTFRFVMIDEIFSRSDHENSRYAMELFKELGLQLLVVTPMTALHVVEPYISACHFVFNDGEGRNSQVENMTLGQLRQQPPV